MLKERTTKISWLWSDQNQLLNTLNDSELNRSLT